MTDFNQFTKVGNIAHWEQTKRRLIQKVSAHPSRAERTVGVNKVYRNKQEQSNYEQLRIPPRVSGMKKMFIINLLTENSTIKQVTVRG